MDFSLSLPERPAIMLEEEPIGRRSLSPIKPINLLQPMASAKLQQNEEEIYEEVLDYLVKDMQPQNEQKLTQKVNDLKDKEIKRIPTYVKPMEEKTNIESTTTMNKTIQPKSDFAKKAIVQPMKNEKLQIVEQKTLQK